MSLLETPLEFCNVWEIVTTVAFRYVYSYSIYYVTMSDEDKSDMSASPQLQWWTGQPPSYSIPAEGT